MLKKINSYLQFKGLTQIDLREYEELVYEVRRGQKVDVIKALRTFSKRVDERYIQFPALYDDYTNEFYDYLVNEGKACYEGPDSRTLGLKEAKSVVDVMFANLDAL